MNVILFDDPVLWRNLLPLTFTRPISEIRFGILKIVEKWERYNWEKISYLTEDYLESKYVPVMANDNLLINSKYMPDADLNAEIHSLEPGESITKGGEIIALRCDSIELESIIKTRKFNAAASYEYNQEVFKIEHITDIFSFNGVQIRKDFEVVVKGRESATTSDPHTVIYNPENVFIEEGLKIKAAILNAEDGPIYIGSNVEIQEGAMIRGPFSIGRNSIISMGGKIRPNTSIGPFCKVGGEVSNSIIFGYSNKGHEGYLGNSIIGEWCNLGADTNTSNMKNNYAEVRIWNYLKEDFQPSGKQFCGTIMGDHVKTGINTMLNTGTVVGVGANIFGGGFPPKFIPSFSWGGAEGFEEFDLEKNLEIAAIVMKRLGVSLTHSERGILKQVFKSTSFHRSNFS